MRIFRQSMIALAALVLLSASADAAERYEGAWVTSVKECGKEGWTSLTVIDLKVMIHGKPRPMVDQYENHCFIDRKSTTGNETTLAMTCYEFWDAYKKKVDSRKATIKLSLGPKDTLKIDGKVHHRCPETAAKKRT